MPGGGHRGGCGLPGGREGRGTRPRCCLRGPEPGGIRGGSPVGVQAGGGPGGLPGVPRGRDTRGEEPVAALLSASKLRPGGGGYMMFFFPPPPTPLGLFKTHFFSSVRTSERLFVIKV